MATRRKGRGVNYRYTKTVYWLDHLCKDVAFNQFILGNKRLSIDRDYMTVLIDICINNALAGPFAVGKRVADHFWGGGCSAVLE